MKTIFWAAVLALGLLLPAAAGRLPGCVEHIYSHGLFPALAALLGIISAPWRISLAQILLGLAAALFLLFLVRILRRALHGRPRDAGFTPPHRWLMVPALLLWSFELLWGLNYARPPLADRLALPAAEVDTRRLLHLAHRLAGEAGLAYRQALEQDELVERRFFPEGASSAPAASAPAASAPATSSPAAPAASASHFCVGRAVIAKHLSVAYTRLEPGFAHLPLAPPKFPWPAGWVMTRLGISGLYFPFTGEALVNREPPDAGIPFSAAHEMAHQRGTAREDEANFMAYLACRSSDLPCIRYSGALGAFELAAAALWRTAPDSALALAGEFERGIRADREAARAFWRKHEGPAEKAAERVNDAYLKANLQRAGVRSYGRAVELLAAYDSLLAAGKGSESEVGRAAARQARATRLDLPMGLR